MKRSETELAESLKTMLDRHSSQTPFDALWEKNLSRKANPRYRLKVIAISIAAAVILPATVYSYHQIKWEGVGINILQEDEDQSFVRTPIEGFDQVLRISKKYSLEESRGKADFPIRQPGDIKPWTLAKSIGLVQPNTISKGGGKSVTVDGPLFYAELYEHEHRKAERIVVFQSFDSTMTEALKKENNHSYENGYPKGTRILDDFGSDFAALMDLDKGRYLLQILHIEDNQRVTKFDIWGNTDPAVLINVGHAYLSQ